MYSLKLSAASHRETEPAHVPKNRKETKKKAYRGTLISTNVLSTGSSPKPGTATGTAPSRVADLLKTVVHRQF